MLFNQFLLFYTFKPGEKRIDIFNKVCVLFSLKGQKMKKHRNRKIILVSISSLTCIATAF